MMAKKSPDEPIPGDSPAEAGTPTVGGGWPVIDGWAKGSLSLQGPLLRGPATETTLRFCSRALVGSPSF